MPDYNIKISELNAVTPNPPFTEDFFPLVHSASMTTYRATLQDIGSLMTHSIFSDTASFALNVPETASNADTASFSFFAISASYAISASHARLADSASYYPLQAAQISSSWASRSLQSWYATRSIDVDTHGYVLNVPIWEGDTPGLGNGNLRAYSPLSIIPDELNTLGSSRYTYGPVIIDSASTLTNNGVSPAPPNSTWVGSELPNYTLDKYNHSTNKIWAEWGPGGISTFWPITSQTFNGTDQKFFNYWTGSGASLEYTNSFFSGSAGNASSGSWITIPTGPGAISSSFNGKWFRVVARGQSTLTSYPQVSKHAPMGDVYSPYYDIGSLIRVQCNTGVGNIPGIGDKTNINHIFYIFVTAGVWATQPVVQVLSTNRYNGQLIKAGRVHHSVSGTDPWWALDFYIDGMSAADDILKIALQSWNGTRFLSTANWGPWPIEDSGSNDPRSSNYLIFPIAPGHYDATSPNGDNIYNLHGVNVNINPHYNEVTRSGFYGASSPYPLNVSGTINASTGYYCNGSRGLTTVATWGSNNLYFSGGILVDKYPPDTYVPPVAGTSCGGVTKYTGGPAMPTQNTWVLGSGTGIVTVHFNTFTVPDRLQVVFDNNVILDTGYRGDTINQVSLNTYLTLYGSASATITSPGQVTASWYKNSATTTALVRVFAPIPGTAWYYAMSCPGGVIS